MESGRETVVGDVLEGLTLRELIELWDEDEIDKRLKEVDFFHADIIDGALALDRLQVMPLRGGFCETPRCIEVLVEVRDHLCRRSCIGAWQERRFGQDDEGAFQRAYDKAMAHAIIQLLPANLWRPWVRKALRSL